MMMGYHIRMRCLVSSRVDLVYVTVGNYYHMRESFPLSGRNGRLIMSAQILCILHVGIQTNCQRYS